ncbi:MAG: metallophosphoesterase [Oscillospiraceae bacterium]|jgi:protein phosphatase|nr:metallophosphoesterase [Oscillospiraceae bacterium]
MEAAGPFDIIGDVHGCYDELALLLEALGYRMDRPGFCASPPPGRRAVFLGDLCDRGPKNAQSLLLAMNMADSGAALCVVGNHDDKLLRNLRGGKVRHAPEPEDTARCVRARGAAFARRVAAFIEGLPSHCVFDGGGLVIAHAGLKEEFHGRYCPQERHFCLYGDTTGERDEYGFPVRRPWMDDYRGGALVVYGHTPLSEVMEVNNTICIDTGCVFGGALTALRYPERELVSIPAARTYFAPVLPLAPGHAASC